MLQLRTCSTEQIPPLRLDRFFSAAIKLLNLVTSCANDGKIQYRSNCAKFAFHITSSTLRY